MEVNFTPDVQAKLDRLGTETGRSAGEFVLDAMAGYVDELNEVRSTLDSRYEDLKSGRVKPISGDEVIARLRAKSAARRAKHSWPGTIFTRKQPLTLTKSGNSSRLT